MSSFSLSTLLLLQLAVILLSCRSLAWVFRRIGQPAVVAEMIAGVLLGPSLLGALAPELSASLFPAASKPILGALAQLALVLYMFLVGCQFDHRLLKGKVGAAAAVSTAGIAAPFALGALLAWQLSGRLDLFPSGGHGLQTLLFMGVAMSITAFPVLARILQERGLEGTPLAVLALGAGAFDDAIAGCVLALVLASLKGDPSIALLTVLGTLSFTALVLGPLRRVLPRLLGRVGVDLDATQLVRVLGLLLLAGWCTDVIGIHAVFGAFLFGLAMPRGAATESLQRQLMPLTQTLLLPIYFACSGLNTQVGLLNSPALWALAALVLACAVLGKGGACYLAARWQGMPQDQAAAVGSLMNARGLMELIILNIGLQVGLITPTLFTVMVLMAIATTLMATPMFNRAYRASARPSTA